MKKFYAFAAAALVALAASAQEPLYITGAGDFDNGTWNPGNPDVFEYNGANYVKTVKNLTQFKISTTSGTAEGDWNGFNVGAFSIEGGYGDVPGVAKEIFSNPDAGNIECPWKGDYTITVDGDLKTITLNTNTPKPSDDEITPVYLRGDMNGWGNDAAQRDEWQMTGIIQGVYKFVCSDDQTIFPGDGFKIADADWNVYNFGSSEILTLDADYLVQYNAPNMQLAAEWYGVCWADLRDREDAYVIFSNDKAFIPEWAEEILAGVEGVTVENNVAPVYYNLQGVKVNNPENGIFIVKKGNEVKKVVK